MIAHFYSNTKAFEAEMSRENSLKMLTFATNNDAIFEIFLLLHASVLVTSRWPESSGWPSQGAKKDGRWNERLSLVRCVMRSKTGARALETEG